MIKIRFSIPGISKKMGLNKVELGRLNDLPNFAPIFVDVLKFFTNYYIISLSVL